MGGRAAGPNNNPYPPRPQPISRQVVTGVVSNLDFTFTVSMYRHSSIREPG